MSDIEGDLSQTEQRRFNIYHHQLQHLFVNALNPIVLIDNQGQLVDANPAACQFFNCNYEQLTQCNLNQFSTQKLTKISDKLNSHETIEGTDKLILNDGSWRQVKYRIVPNFCPKHHLLNLQDITNEERLKSDLLDLYKSHQLVIRKIGEGLWDWNYHTDKIIVSPRYWEIQGYDAKEMNDDCFSDFISRVHPEDRHPLQRIIANHLCHHGNYEIEMRIKHRNGDYIWIYSCAQAIWDKDNQPLHIVGTIADISNYKQAEMRLQEQQNLFNRVTSNIPGAIFRYILHTNGLDKVIYMSSGCYDIWEISANKVAENAKFIWDLIYPEDYLETKKSVIKSAETLEPWVHEWRIITPSGKKKWLHGIGKPEKQANGDVIWDSFVIDITQRKEAELALKKSEYHLRSVLQTIPLIGLIVDHTGSITFANDYLLKHTGWKQEEIFKKSWFSLFIPPEIRDSMHRIFFDYIATRGKIPERYENEIVTRTGERRLIAWNNTTLRDRNNQIVAFASIGEDITDRRKAEQALQQQILQERLILEITHQVRQSLKLEEILTTAVTAVQETLDAIKVTVFRFDDNGVGTVIAETEEINEPLEPADNGESLQTLDAPIMKSSEDYVSQVWGLLMVHNRPESEKFSLAKPSFLQRVADQLAIAIQQSELYQQAQNKLIQHQKINDHLEYNVLHDMLTGLPNRTALMEQLCKICQPQKPPDPLTKFAILFLDLNNFKNINDTLGHRAGDQLLVIVGECLQTCIRESDLVARLGGDEFVIILNIIRTMEDVIEVSDRIHTTLDIPIKIQGITVNISTSIGITIGQHHHGIPEQLLDQADRAMYQAKRKKLKYFVFT